MNKIDLKVKIIEEKIVTAQTEPIELLNSLYKVFNVSDGYFVKVNHSKDGKFVKIEDIGLSHYEEKQIVVIDDPTPEQLKAYFLITELKQLYRRTLKCQEKK